MSPRLRQASLIISWLLVNFVQAQTFKGHVFSNFYEKLNSELQIKRDSTVLWVEYLPDKSVFLVYDGVMKRFHRDIFMLQVRQSFSNMGWGVLDAETGQTSKYAHVWIDSSLQNLTGPVTIEYQDGTTINYPFKGPLKLDTLKLNAQHPTYKVYTHYIDSVLKKPLICSARYTNNMVMGRDTNTIRRLVRFRNDSMVTVPTSYIKYYNTWIFMKRVKGSPIRIKQIEKKTPKFDFPDVKSWRQPGDSLIYADEIQIKYGTDTLRQKQVTQYCKGRYMGEYRVVKEDGIIDSSLYLNRYDSTGKHIGIITRWYQALQCDSFLNRGENEPQWRFSGERIPIESISYPCPRYSSSMISFSKKDTIGVKCVEDYYHEYKTHTFARDTIWYFRNGLKYYEKHYNDSSLNHVWRYDYVYGQDARLQNYSVRVTHMNGYEVSLLYNVNGKDTLLIKTTTRYQADSTQGQYTIYYSDPKTKIYWFKNYQNNKVSNYSVSFPLDSLCINGGVTKSFDKDSVWVNSEQEINCYQSRSSKGRFEQWNMGRHASYHRYDTVMVSTGIVVKHYSGYPGYYPRFESPPINQCTLMSITTLDKFRRPLLFTEYEDSRVKRKIKYSYSK